MKHRNKNLVYTEKDMYPQDPNKNDTNNILKRKNSDGPDDDQNKKRKTNSYTPRRSARLATRKNNQDPPILNIDCRSKNADNNESDHSTSSDEDEMEMNDTKNKRKYDSIDEKSSDTSMSENETSDDEKSESIEDEPLTSDEDLPEKSDETDSMDDFIVNDDLPSDIRKNIDRTAKKIASSILGIRPKHDTTDDDYDEISDELADEPWFKELSDEDQVLYIEKFKELRTFKEKIPTLKDIVDLPLDSVTIKELIEERKGLDDYDKMDSTYENACNKFIKKYNFLTNPQNIQAHQRATEVEKELIEQPKFEQPLRYRILNSDFDPTTKSIIYDKYVTMCGCDRDDANKYKLWIDTALSIPHHPKKLFLDKTLPQNEALSNLLTTMMTKLNEKIYGMQEAKEELLCIIANMMVNPKSKNKAIGLFGPPGIGKTMIASVLAEVLELPIEQIALGGVTNSTFLEGHGFTYKGSEPGCIVKAAIRMKYTNGIIFLDELDKISKSDKGKEIEHCLLHITDFTQNHDFRDKYMPEIPVDLSDYIFIYSMNTIAELDSALASRIPVIKFEGYSFKEKIDIVEKYILPEILSNHGMTANDIIVPRETVEYLINNIREEDEINGKSGVRGLKKAIIRIIKRINLYRLAAVNGKMNIKLSFDIPHFTLPFVLKNDLVHKIISSIPGKNNSMYPHMYI